jgi:hypothetical protein
LVQFSELLDSKVALKLTYIMVRELDAKQFDQA